MLPAEAVPFVQESKRVPRDPSRECPLMSPGAELGHVAASGWQRGQFHRGSP